MRRFFKYLIRTLGSIFGLLLLIVFLLYLPPVQGFLLRQAERYLASDGALSVQIGYFRLGFPLDLNLKDACVVQTSGDTLAAVENLHVKVNFRRIWRHQAEIEDITLHGVKFALKNDTSGLALQVGLDTLKLQTGCLDWKHRRLAVQELCLKEGGVALRTGMASAVTDTVEAKPLDWKIEVERFLLERVAYDMQTASLPYLGAGMENALIARSRVGLAEQSVAVDSLGISGGWCRMQTAAAVENEIQPEIVSEESPSMPWQVRAGHVCLENSAFSMLGEAGEKTDLLLSGIALQIDSVYNRGQIVRCRLQDLRAVQSDGLQIEQMCAQVALDSTETCLNGGLLRTPHSQIELQVRADTSVGQLMKQIPLVVELKAMVGLADLTPFYGDIPKEMKDWQLALNTAFRMSEKLIALDRFGLSLPGKLRLTAQGQIKSFRDWKNISGRLNLRGDMPDATFANFFLKSGSVRIPTGVEWTADLQADHGALTALTHIYTGQGNLKLYGFYDQRQEMYDGELALNHFPLDRFLALDSLGEVSALIQLKGQYFSWAKAKATVNVGIHRFPYGGHEYENVELRAGLDKTSLRGELSSRDRVAPLNLVFQGDSLEQRYQARLDGYIGEVNLQALNFIPEFLTVGTKVNLQGFLEGEDHYALQMHLDSVHVADSRKQYLLGNLDFNLDSGREKTDLKLKTGDLQFAFQADTSLTGMRGCIEQMTEIIKAQIAERNIDMEKVRMEVTPFSLQVDGAQNNVIAKFLKVRNIGFRELSLGVVARKRSGIRMGMIAKNPYFGSVRLDSVQLGVWQTGESLVYALGAGSSDESWKGLFNVSLTGKMQGNEFRLELKQKDAQQQVGFDMGINLTMLDSVFTLAFFPMNPILGYSRWFVNADNKITVYKDWRIKADLRMAYQNKLISLQSLPDEGGRSDRMQIDINGVDLKKLTGMSPFLPDLSGVLQTDLLLYTQEDTFGAEGNIAIKELNYEEERIGTLDLDMQYAGAANFTDHTVAFELKIDSIRRAALTGTFATSETNRDVEVDMDIPSFPLYIVNAFVPRDLMRLSGELEGNMHFRGTVDAPELGGELAFRDGKADVVMLGTVFRLDTAHLAIDKGRMLFHNYRFIAPNNSNMLLNGVMALTPFDQMNMDLSIKANDFEVVNVKKNPVSLVYGNAYVNIDSRLTGGFSNLSVAGNINLLNRTNITYTLRNSTPEFVDKSTDFVRFVSFRDSTMNESDEYVTSLNASSFMLKMLMEIGDQVVFVVDLSEDGSDQVVIRGGGNLVLSMNPESGLTLSGKYILSGGTVVYNVPVAGKKEFNIRTGSYVEWTGRIANPLLNISAAEQVKATVEDGEQNRLVTFESIIRIQNNLTRPDISFDLSAPNDMVVQNQLATFSQEERTRQALNLLIYNTYTAPGAAKSGTTSGTMANNALYSLVENELNKYTRKTGFTFGVDTYNTDENTTRTDYTYQFSKQFFNDRVRVKIGGRISTDNSENQSGNVEDNLVDDISIEYVITKKRNLFLKVFRHSNYESVLDGEVTQTGIGVVWRKSFQKFKDLFKNIRKGKKENKKNQE